MLVYIGCSANDNIPQKYLKDCEMLLDIIMENNDLIFGACNQGLMGMSYKFAKKYNRNITGICPIAYKENLKDITCDNELITNKILESTMTIIEKCDAIIILPGGFGTLYEIFTAIQSKLCNEHNKPIIIYNSCGYYNSLLSFIDNMFEQGFCSLTAKEAYSVANTIEDLTNYLNKINK